MAKPSESPKFKELCEEWYKKLHESGFRDIENQAGEMFVLKESGTSRRFKHLDAITREARLQFYDLVSQYTEETDFPNDLERQIMVLYGQGMSQVMIQKTLKLQGHRCKIYYPLYRWLRRWGLR